MNSDNESKMQQSGLIRILVDGKVFTQYEDEIVIIVPDDKKVLFEKMYGSSNLLVLGTVNSNQQGLLDLAQKFSTNFDNNSHPLMKVQCPPRDENKGVRVTLSLNKFLRSVGSAREVSSIIGDLTIREEVGLSTYHQYLRSFNGRDANRDLYEELLDAMNYAIQCALEAPEMEEIYHSIIKDLLKHALIVKDKVGNIPEFKEKEGDMLSSRADSL